MSDYTPIKRCRTCGIDKTLDNFHNHNDTKDRLNPDCKLCKREKDRIYYMENKERVKLRARAWAEANPDKVSGYKLRYRVERKDRIRKTASIYYAKNKATAIIYCHQRRARVYQAEGTHTVKEKKDQFSRQKGICYYCDCKLINPFKPKPKKTTKSIAHWEHIVPLVRGGRNSLDNLVWACKFCNLSKSDKLLTEWHAPNGRLM